MFLAGIYDHLQNLILSDNITSFVSLGATSKKDRYLGYFKSKLDNTTERYHNCYKREESLLRISCPGTEKVPYISSPFKATKISTRDTKSFIFVKMEQTKTTKDAIMPVNDGYFLEI